MSEQELLKRNLLALLPEGALRQLVPDGDEDKLWDAIADVILPGYETMRDMACIRDPRCAADFESLEKEYGFLPDPMLTEDERRARVASLKYAPAGSGSANALQTALHLAGFSQLVVGEGRADIDPRTLIAGTEEYVVNGIEFISLRGFDVGCNMTVGSPDDFDVGCTAMPSSLGCVPVRWTQSAVYNEPTDNFNLVFYVAEEIVYDVNGYITSITPATIDRYYRKIIIEIILRIKPLHTWGCLFIDWTDPAGYGFGYFPMGITPHGL